MRMRMCLGRRSRCIYVSVGYVWHTEKSLIEMMMINPVYSRYIQRLAQGEETMKTKI